MTGCKCQVKGKVENVGSYSRKRLKPDDRKTELQCMLIDFKLEYMI